MSDGGFVIVGRAVDFFRLCSLRGMLKMEKVGLKTRGGALRPRIAAEFGLKKTDSHDVFIAEINKRIEEASKDPEVQQKITLINSKGETNGSTS